MCNISKALFLFTEGEDIVLETLGSPAMVTELLQVVLGIGFGFAPCALRSQTSDTLTLGLGSGPLSVASCPE